MRAVSFSLLVLMVVLAPACALGDPDPDASFSRVRYHSGASHYFRGEVGAARSSIKIALNRFVDRQLIMLLNDVAARGVRVQIVVDTKQEASLAGINRSLISVSAGNPLGEMQSNFAIIDDLTAVFFSDANVINPNTIAISVRQSDLVSALLTEFRQMHDNESFGSRRSGGRAKQELNHQRVFPTADGDIEMYFVPQNDALRYVGSRMKQARNSVHVYAKTFENADLNFDFNDVAGSSGERLTTYFASGNANLINSLGRPFLMGNEQNTILNTDLPCNAIFVDLGTPRETLLFTTFPFMSNEMLDISDGVVLFLRGSGVRQLKEALAYQVRVAPHYAGGAFGDLHITSRLRLAAFNVLHIGVNPKNYLELARVIRDGRFDVVGLTEVRRDYEGALPGGGAGTPAYIDGRHSVGQGVSCLRLALQGPMGFGNNTWDFHVSAGPAPSYGGPLNGGRNSVEFYGFIYKNTVITNVASLGFYPDLQREFIRAPYGVLMLASTGVNFIYILQHAHWGNGTTDPQREAAVLYKVWNHFARMRDTGAEVPVMSEGKPLVNETTGAPVTVKLHPRDQIILGGDYNLAADHPAFDTMYSLAGAGTVTWAISPEILTTLGHTDFSSAYDNIFYDGGLGAYGRVLGSGRGAFTEWVTTTDFRSYPGFINNFQYARTFVSDHVPVYITFNTTPRTEVSPTPPAGGYVLTVPRDD
jgi:hypothetical protein